MKLNSKSGKAGFSPGTVVNSWNGFYVVVLIPARLQGFAQRENSYVY